MLADVHEDIKLTLFQEKDATALHCFLQIRTPNTDFNMYYYP